MSADLKVVNMFFLRLKFSTLLTSVNTDMKMNVIDENGTNDIYEVYTLKLTLS